MAPFQTAFLEYSLLFKPIGRHKLFQWEDIHKRQLLAKYQRDLILNKFTRAKLCVIFSCVHQQHAPGQSFTENPRVLKGARPLRMLGEGNHVIILASSFLKSLPSKMFPVHTKNAKPAFSNSFGLKITQSVLAKLLFCDGLVWTMDLTRKIKFCIQKSLAQCETKNKILLFLLF